MHHVVANHARRARQKDVTRVKAVVAEADAVRVVETAAEAEAAVAVVVIAPHKVHVSVLMLKGNPSMRKWPQTCRRRPMDLIKTHHDQSSQTIVRHATRNAQTVVAVVAGNAQRTSTLKMRVSAMSHVQKDAMSVGQSAVVGQMMHGSMQLRKAIQTQTQKSTPRRQRTVTMT